MVVPHGGTCAALRGAVLYGPDRIQTLCCLCGGGDARLKDSTMEKEMTVVMAVCFMDGGHLCIADD
jgi:hypothetical protein